MSPAIVPTQTEDLDEVLALLNDVGLPSEGVKVHFGQFLVARDGGRLVGCVGLPSEGVKVHFGQFLVARDGGRLVGCVGLECYSDAALLRSLAVVPDRQRDGLGQQLTARLLEGARSSGVREVVLLTTTAADF